MATYPAYVTTGTIKGVQYEISVDTTGDVDTKPDAIYPVGATFTFTPSVAYLLFPDQSPDHSTVWLDEIQGVIGSDGLVKTPGGDVLELPSTDLADNFVWTVTPKIGGITRSKFSIEVAPGVDNYLANQMPVAGATSSSSPFVRGPAGPAGPGAPPTGTPDDYVATSVGELTVWLPPTAGDGSVINLDSGYLATTGTNGDYASSQAAICSITGPIDVRWFGSGLTVTGTGAFRTIVNVEGAFDFRQLGSSGKLAVNAQNGAASQVGNVGGATVPAGSGYRTTYDPGTGAASIQVLDAAGTIVTSDGHSGTQHWTLIANFTVPALTGGQLTAGAKRVGVAGLTTNGTEGNALKTTRVQIFDGIGGTMVVDVDFTGQEDAPASGTFVDAHGHTWVVNGHAAIIPVAGTVTKGGVTLDIASKNDLKKTVGIWGFKRINPLTGCFHLSQFGDPGVDPDTWTVAQESAAFSAARAAAVASTDLGNGYGQTVYVDRPVTINADPTILDPISGLPYCAIPSWDYLTIRAAGLSTPIKLADAQNCHIIGHPGRTQADGSSDQIFNFALENVTLDGNRANQDGTHRHDGIHIPQHPGYQLHHVRLLNIDGKGLYTTALGEFSSVPPRLSAFTTGSTVWTLNTAPASITVASTAGFPVGGTTLDVLDGGGNPRSVKYTGIAGNTFTGVTLLGGVATAGTVAAGSPVYIDSGTHSVRPVFLTDVRAINCAHWGFFLSATNRDTTYKGMYATSCGSPQALIAGTNVCTAIGANGHLDLVIDNNASVPIAFLATDSPASVVTKINAALGATATAALTSQGILKITSATVGGISKVYVQGTSTKGVLTNLGLTTAPKNGDNNYRAGANEYGGFFLDHSECTTDGLFADSNYGDGFYIHNVNLCHYGSLHATRNNGIGIYVDALNHSTGWSWASSMNCQDFGAASYRTPADSAEIYFDSGTEGYGITKDSTITGIVGPGDKTTSGTLADNRRANWSVYVADGITLTVGGDQPNGASLKLSTINYGDGGLVGVLRPPAAYLPSGPGAVTPAGIFATGRFDPTTHVYTPAGAQTLVKLPAKLAQSRKGLGRTKIAFLGASNVAGWDGAATLRGKSDYPRQVSEMFHAAGWDASEPLFTFNDAIAADTRGSISGVWVYSAHPANAVYVAGSGGATLTCVCSRQGDTVEVAVSGTSAAFTVTVDGVVITSAYPGLVSTNGTYSTSFATPDGGSHVSRFKIPNLPLGAHTVTLTLVGGVVPLWVDVYNSKGVSVANFGSSGTRTVDWNDTSLYYTLLNEVIAWGPDAVVLDTGLQFNSWQGGESLATSLTNLKAIVATLQGAGIEVILNGVTPAISPVTGTPPLAFWQNFFALADAAQAQYIEQYSAWGSSEATALANGLMGGTDTVHPSAAGYSAISKLIGNALGIAPWKRLLPLRVNDGILSAALPSALAPNTVTAVNPTTAAFAVVFPTTPDDGTLMGLTHVGSNGNLVTITPGGTDTITGTATIGRGQSELWIYFAASTTWLRLADTAAPSTDSWTAATPYATGQVVTLPTGGRGFRTAAGTARGSFDATERALWTFIPGGHYEVLTASGNWTCPAGITHARVELQGGGGGGGGGTSSATINSQVGASGAGAGMRLTFEESTLVPGTNYAYTHGPAGAGGAGGAVGGHPGVNGSDGTDAVFAAPSGTKTAKGGCKGFTTAATDTTGAVGGGIMGWPSGQNGAASITNGCGGASGIGSVWSGNVVGGAGGGTSSATKGGAGGQAATTFGQIVNNTSAGTAAGINGENGTTATIPGCGGGGGGAGHKADGIGGNGGNGADGFLALWF